MVSNLQQCNDSKILNLRQASQIMQFRRIGQFAWLEMLSSSHKVIQLLNSSINTQIHGCLVCACTCVFECLCKHLFKYFCFKCFDKDAKYAASNNSAATERWGRVLYRREVSISFHSIQFVPSNELPQSIFISMWSQHLFVIKSDIGIFSRTPQMEESGVDQTVMKMKPSFYWTLNQISQQLDPWPVSCSCRVMRLYTYWSLNIQNYPDVSKRQFLWTDCMQVWLSSTTEHMFNVLIFQTN